MPKCPVCGSVMWTTASAIFTERGEVEKRLSAEFGDYDPYFSVEYERTRVIRESGFEEMLSAVGDLLSGRDMSAVVFMPRGWWIRCEHCFGLDPEALAGFARETGAVRFKDPESALGFLRANMVYGTVFEYLIMDEKLEWIVTICKDMEIHYSGSPAFFDSITDYGDQSAPPVAVSDEDDGSAPDASGTTSQPAARPTRASRAPRKGA